MKKKIVITAGPLRREAIFTPPTRWDTPQARREKCGHSSEARKKMNDKLAKRKLEMLIAANFTPQDYFVTLTYSNEDLPARRALVQKDVKKYIADLRKVRNARGEVTRYLYAIENRHGEGRFHVHMILNRSSGNDFEEIRSLWTHGDTIEIQALSEWASPDNPGFKALSEYMAKESGDRPLGARMWSGSKNLEKPKKEYFWVPDNEKIAPPKGSTIIEREEKATQYGSYSYCKYILPEKKPKKKPTRKPAPRQKTTHRSPDKGTT